MLQMDSEEEKFLREDYEHTPAIQVIKANMVRLRDALQPVTRFVPELRCFDRDERKKIKEEEKKNGLCRASDLFLKMLIRKKGFWQEFIEALREDDKEELATELLKGKW